MNRMIAMMLCILPMYSLAQDIKPFRSDGCSLFPDGDLNNRTLWCECCFKHDIAYWMGGKAAEKERADVALRDCVVKKTGNKILAEIMYRGVQVGGHPVFPTGYRWGYGWPYLRGFKGISPAEKKQIEKRLQQLQPDQGQYCHR